MKTFITWLKKILSYIFTRKKKTMESDHPITENAEDHFHVYERYVEPIILFLSEVQGQMTVALTGEWGIGKSSVQNLLRNELAKKKKNLIINFEPLAEGKTELVDLIGLFYIKLYNQLDASSKLKKMVSKSLKSLAIFSRAKIDGQVELNASALGFPGAKAKVNLGYDLGKNIDAFLELIEKEKPKDFSTQAEQLNKELKKHGCKLYIFIDEIDRLPASYILNFLLFCRILEMFDDMVCFVCIDYTQSIQKLSTEPSLCLGDLTQTQGYLDKLFQVKYHVHQKQYDKLNFVKERLNELDANLNINLIQSIQEGDIYGRKILEDIIFFLDTPRQIKKWLINIIKNKILLKNHHTYKWDFLAFLAVTVKHPTIFSYLSKHTVLFLQDKHNARSLLEKFYGYQCPDGFTFSDILAASVGVFKQSNEDINGKIVKHLNVNAIVHSLTYQFVITYLDKTPTFLVLLFIEGFTKESQVSLYQDFFENDINKTLRNLVAEQTECMDLISALAETIAQGAPPPKTMPERKLITALWNQKIGDNDLYNPYEPTILFIANVLSIEEIILQLPITLSENYINALLFAVGIKNNKGTYNIEEDFNPSTHIDVRSRWLIFAHVQKTQKKLTEFDAETIKNILEEWINEFENKLTEEAFYRQPRLISAFYRYIQWSHTINSSDKRENLTALILGVLGSKSVSNADKEWLKAIITNEIEKYKSNHWDIADPRDVLFAGESKQQLLQVLGTDAK
jgi:ABC-type dipeptide/oligopeptide/nickel transport system ATPase subunit